MLVNNHVKIYPYTQVLTLNYYQIGISHLAQCDNQVFEWYVIYLLHGVGTLSERELVDT